MRIDPPRSSRWRGFTLIELLIVIAILGVLSTVLIPVFESAMEKAESTRCVGNLRQIGIATLAAAADLGGYYPKIETSRTDPVYPPEDGAKMIGEVLAPYGIGPDVLRCPTDAKGKNYHALEGTSYEWRPLVDGEPITAVMMYMRFGTFSVSPSRVRMVTDYEGVHRGKQNRLYADGHVVGH